MTWTAALEKELRLLIVAEYKTKKRKRYQSMCEGKYKFASPVLAHATMRHRDMTAFHCKFCGSWHVAHSRPKMKGKNHA